MEGSQNSTDPQPQSDKPVLSAFEITERSEISVVDKLSSIIETLLTKDEQEPTVPIADKLLLTVPEVQALTGLPKDFLREAINEGRLKGVRIGRSWRVKRKDLEEFVAELF